MFENLPPRRGSRKLPGFTMIELLVLLVIAGVLLSVGVPTYLRSQRLARLRGASQELQGTLAGLRNLAQTGKQIQNALQTSNPDGYCLRAVDVSGSLVLQAFSFEDSNRDGLYSPRLNHTDEDLYDDETAQPSLSPAYVPVPELRPDRTSVRLTAVYLADRPADEQPAIAEDRPVLSLCFEPPNARVTVFDETTGDLLSPTSVAFELADGNRPAEVLRVQLDSVTGRVTYTTSVGATAAPAEEPTP